ncbi:hypothetical protein F4806DRAFT_465356 [Annulohypoxylon nitens]|nr:hypothetical protein F4806DRAFT_465356 [Annulohypoxylon nitens]
MDVLEIWESTSTAYDEQGIEVRRNVIPYEISLRPRVPARRVLSWHPIKEAATLHDPYLMGGDEPHKTIILVALYGVSHKRPGIRPARATWAVSFGHRSPHNASALLNPSYPQTDLYAKVEALSQAMDIIAREFPDDGERLEFLIVTDLCISPNLSEGIKDWVYRMYNPLHANEFAKISVSH